MSIINFKKNPEYLEQIKEALKTLNKKGLHLYVDRDDPWTINKEGGFNGYAHTKIDESKTCKCEYDNFGAEGCERHKGLSYDIDIYPDGRVEEKPYTGHSK